jgi:hypothetical protein
MANLITTSEYKTWANIGTTAYDTIIGTIVSGVSTEIRRWCGRDTSNGFESMSRTERYDGNNEQTINLMEWPVSSVTSVKVYASDGTYETLDSTTYRVDSSGGILSCVDPIKARYPVTAFGTVQATFSVQPWFPDGFDNIEVVYTGGYATIPDDLKIAAFRLADMHYAARGRNMGVVSESLGQYSYSNFGNGELTELKLALTRAYTGMRS